MEPANTINRTESNGEGNPANAGAVQRRETPIPEAAKPGELGENRPIESGSGASDQKGEDQWPREQPLSPRDKRASNERKPERTWLMDDPQGWVGRRVRSRRNMALYTISQVYKNG